MGEKMSFESRPSLDEVGCGDESCAALDLVPLHHLLVGDVPQAQLPVQRGRQEELKGRKGESVMTNSTMASLITDRPDRSWGGRRWQ